MNKKRMAILLSAALFYYGCAPQTLTSTAVPLNEVQPEATPGIVGGVAADSSFQKQNGVVGLVIITQQGRGFTAREATSLCTGTLIKPRVVLTAAHCLTPGENEKILRVGVHFKTNLNTVKKEDIYYVDMISVNKDFQKNVDFTNPTDRQVWNDIALVRLPRDAPREVRPATLAQRGDASLLSANAKVLLTGFGINTPVVNRVKIGLISGKEKIVPVIEKTPSSGILRKIASVPVLSVTADEKEIFLDQKNSTGACHGDSGGPAFLTRPDGSLLQVGVTSRGTNQLGNCDQQAIYTGVIGQADWISSNVEVLLKDPR